MSYRFFVTIEGAVQGKFKTDDQKDPKSSRINAVGYDYDVVSPRDPRTGQATGRRQHGPVKITKALGPSSPQCFKALVTNEAIKSVLIEFVHVNPQGQEQVYFTVTLANASITEYRQLAGVARPDNYATDWPNEAEQVTFTFQKITLEHVPTHTTASDQVTIGP